MRAHPPAPVAPTGRIARLLGALGLVAAVVRDGGVEVVTPVPSGRPEHEGKRVALRTLVQADGDVMTHVDVAVLHDAERFAALHAAHAARLAALKADLDALAWAIRWTRYGGYLVGSAAPGGYGAYSGASTIAASGVAVVELLLPTGLVVIAVGFATQVGRGVRLVAVRLVRREMRRVARRV